jgi:hypothetical protein
VGAAKIPDLTLFGWTLGDGGAALVEYVSMGREPKGLYIARGLFDSAERTIFYSTYPYRIHRPYPVEHNQSLCDTRERRHYILTLVRYGMTSWPGFALLLPQ